MRFYILDYDIYNFDISALQCSVHYTPDGRGDVLNTVIHQNIRLSEVIVNDILHCITYQ
jgi:hypothetical protein